MNLCPILITKEAIRMNERLWELLAKYWTGRISPEEKAEMERLLLEHPDYWLKTGLMQQIHWKPEQLLSSKQADRIADKIVGPAIKSGVSYWNGDADNIATKKTPAILRYWKRSASILFILCILVFSLIYIDHRQSQRPILWQQVTTTNGMKTTLRLADGSELWLNAGSTLRYPESFNERTREVYLTGEAYFNVKHDASKPFIIHTTDMDIRVLGTEFDVRAYADEHYSETSLIKGSVEITVNREKQTQQIYLRPHQKIVVQDSPLEVNGRNTRSSGIINSPLVAANSITRDVMLEPVKMVEGNVIMETAWKENNLVFEDEPLESLSKRLERWYGVKILIKDSTFARQRFTGRADNVSLEKLLHILQIIKPFNYVIEDKEVIIK